MKKIKFIKQTNFVKPKGRYIPDWVKKFQNHDYFKTRTGKVIYSKIRANYMPRWEHADIVLRSNNSGNILYISKYNQAKYLPYEI